MSFSFYGFSILINISLMYFFKELCFYHELPYDSFFFKDYFSQKSNLIFWHLRLQQKGLSVLTIFLMLIIQGVELVSKYHNKELASI